MRIVAGKLRNRTLKTGPHFRPTTDRVRETLFNILQNEIEGVIFVDAFAGSGAVGMEALSRGASFVYFIESNRKTLGILESNLRRCCDGEDWRIYSRDAIKALELIQREEPAVRLIFFDPPYDYKHYPELLLKSAALFPSATYILEASTRTRFEVPSGVQLVKERKVGETALWFYTSKTSRTSSSKPGRRGERKEVPSA